MPSSIRILGVDPGFGRTGIGVVDLSGNEATHVWHEVIDTAKDSAFAERLQAVRNDLQEIVRRFEPHVAGVESLFFQTNVRTAMKVGMARGVLLLALADAGVPIVELTPNQVKQGIAGYGSADKLQVRDMVKRLLRMDRMPKIDDASDALAIAIVAGYHHRTVTRL